MQEELQSLRHALSGAQRRLDALDEARFNHARRVLGLPPARSRPATPPHSHFGVYAAAQAGGAYPQSHSPVSNGAQWGSLEVVVEGEEWSSHWSPYKRRCEHRLTPPPQMFANPGAITRMSADRLRDALEVYLDETPPLEANREQMVKALKVCCGMDEQAF